MIELQEIKARISIEDVLAEQGIYLKRGRCCCPLHLGDNPSSFSVKDGLFHCFACGESGDVISLVQKLQGMDFKEAVRSLAQKAGFPESESGKPITKKGGVCEIRKKQLSGKEAEDEALELLIKTWVRLLRGLEKDLRDGKISLSKYYADQQWIEYQLSRLDELSTYENYHKNRGRKSGKEANGPKSQSRVWHGRRS